MDGFVVLVMAFCTIFFSFAWAVVKHNRNWNAKHPDTLDDYLKKFPDANTGRGIACGHCGSRSLRNMGWQNATDTKRLVSCNSCSSNLYHAEN